MTETTLYILIGVLMATIGFALGCIIMTWILMRKGDDEESERNAITCVNPKCMRRNTIDDFIDKRSLEIQKNLYNRHMVKQNNKEAAESARTVKSKVDCKECTFIDTCVEYNPNLPSIKECATFIEESKHLEGEPVNAPNYMENTLEHEGVSPSSPDDMAGD